MRQLSVEEIAFGMVEGKRYYLTGKDKHPRANGIFNGYTNLTYWIYAEFTDNGLSWSVYSLTEGFHLGFTNGREFVLTED
jgi:hypothetical protein